MRHLAEPFDISRPAISKHLKVLSEAGIVEHRRTGRDHWYALAAGAFDDAEAWIDEISETWKEALGSLKRLIEEESHGKRE